MFDGTALSRVLFSRANLRFALLPPLFLVSACDLSRELNENTLAISATVTDIQNQQIYQNLQSVINDPYAIPAQVLLVSGGIQVTNSATPTIGNFLKIWPSVNASYTNSYTQNWAVTPVIDPADLRRLRALYRLAVYGNGGDRAKLGGDSEFVAVSKAAKFDLEYPRPVVTYPSDQAPKLLDPNTQCRNIKEPNANCPAYPYFYPTASGTSYYPSITVGDPDLVVPHNWLFWSAGPLGPPAKPYAPPLPEKCQPIWPRYFSSLSPSQHTLYRCPTASDIDARQHFDEFVLAIGAAPSNTLASNASGGGGGGGGASSNAKKAAMIQNPAGIAIH